MNDKLWYKMLFSRLLLLTLLNGDNTQWYNTAITLSDNTQW